MEICLYLVICFCFPVAIVSQECRTGQWKCGNKRCIPESERCNGWDNCFDGSDEQNCAECKTEAWLCANNKCIREFGRCDGSNDGYFDCGDDSDEQNCECFDGWKCGNNCIPEIHSCDGTNPCGEDSDEQNCECRPGAWKCANNLCIQASGRCDGWEDCYDPMHSDEQNCTDADLGSSGVGSGSVYTVVPQDYADLGFSGLGSGSVYTVVPQDECTTGAWKCENNNCVQESDRCDGDDNCGDNSDEQNCTVTEDNDFETGGIIAAGVIGGAIIIAVVVVIVVVKIKRRDGNAGLCANVTVRCRSSRLP